MSRAIVLRVVAWLAVGACLGAHWAHSQEAPAQPGKGPDGQKVKRVLYDVKHGVAKDLAEVLAR